MKGPENLKYTDNSDAFLLISGPCVVESRELVFEVAEKLAEMASNLRIPLILKASYRKANRTSHGSFAGIGDEAALEILAAAGQKYGLPTLTDIHTAAEAEMAAQYVDVLQIPAFLCRQTDLLMAAGQTGRYVNIKKGQFTSGQAMGFAVEKVRATGNSNIWLTERGNSWGYTDLVVDFRNIPVMQQHQVPVIMDCTHALQQPNQLSGVSGGNPQLIATIASAAIAAGADGLFLETHPRPAQALSDGANMIALENMPALIARMMRIRKAILDTQ